MRISSENTGLI